VRTGTGHELARAYQHRKPTCLCVPHEKFEESVKASHMGLAITIYMYIYTPYMTVCLVISLPKIEYIHRIHMVMANPNPVSYVLRRCKVQ